MDTLNSSSTVLNFKGHKSVYDAPPKRFGKNSCVFIATSNKVDPEPLSSFEEKRAMMALTGVDPASCCSRKNPTQLK